MASTSFAARLRELVGVAPNADVHTTMVALDGKLVARRQQLQASTSRTPGRSASVRASARKAIPAPAPAPSASMQAQAAPASREKTSAELLDAVRNSPVYKNWKI